ncbi:uracil-DNA glycosylase family protein [Lentilactobacillus sp. Marseille-Q4993]|uniref:uracil-DNA glycosylase family protein n=1 Tax=Lentilactobacillus sp. Marseille-Q4993 TaxID=3039492 RepID=UPI0024BCB545|nr:uracil-DNA glycosylase family protein [Lentilactobacillus sp. Marseille-Q4993]
MDKLTEIINQIEMDDQNQEYTEAGIKPLFHVEQSAKILIISQAPSKKAQASMTFWDDPSGDKLRDWMGVSRDEFYHSGKLGVVPLDFYFPGKGKHGDLPPRKGFAEKWHKQVLELMPNVELTLLIGQYAQKYYLGRQREENLTATVRNYQNYLPDFFPLVHPSPLNYGWQKRNPWFMDEVVPELRERIRKIYDK